MVIEFKNVAEALDTCVKKLIDPNQPGGAWFHEDAEEAYDWFGDVFDEAVRYFLEAMGYTVEWED